MTKLSELKKETLLNTEEYYEVAKAIRAGKPIDFYYSQKSSVSPLYWAGPGAGPEASKRITVQPYALGISNKYTGSGVFMLAMIRKGETFSMSNTGIWRTYYLHRMADIEQSSERWVTPNKRPPDDKLFKNIGEVRSLLKSIGGLENIAEVNKDIALKMTKINQVAKGVDRLTNKVERIYVDLGKRLEDFLLYKAKQDTIDELVKELMKTVDILNIKQEDFITKNDIKSLKETINSLSGRVTEMKKAVDIILPIVKTKIPDHIRTLEKQKEGVVLLLNTLEEAYKNKTLSKKEYEKAFKSNQKQLKKLENILKKEWDKFKKQSKPAKEKKPEETKEIETKPQDAGKTQPSTEAIPESKEKAPGAQEAAEATSSEDTKKESTELKPSEATKEGEEKPEKKPEETPEKTLPAEELKKDEEKKEVQKTPEKKEPKSKEEAKKAEMIEVSNVNSLLADLEDTFKKGLIGKEAFEKTKKALMKKK